jgi:L-lactate utilization protein LutB
MTGHEAKKQLEATIAKAKADYKEALKAAKVEAKADAKAEAKAKKERKKDISLIDTQLNEAIKTLEKHGYYAESEKLFDASKYVAQILIELMEPN